ncbi:MAG TPA: alkaline phosphatase family protein [Thermoplasmata archaeon]|nr:alkaline phosphatase family protein [Thermoplasmata archaeon]
MGAAILLLTVPAAAVLSTAVPTWSAAPRAGTLTYALYPAAPSPSKIPIQHIVVLMQENHDYDNYFGTYCQSTSLTCAYVGNGIPTGTCVLKDPAIPSQGCISPYPFPNGTPLTGDIQHNWVSGHVSLDGGKMDGFYQAERSGNAPFGYFDGKTIPGYWDLAEQYGLGDNFYASTLSYSLPNHWYLMAGAAPAESETVLLKSKGTPNLSGPQEIYLNESNATRAIDDLLINSSVSWTYYAANLFPNYTAAINDHAGGGGAFAYWNPLAAKAETYGGSFPSHFVDRNQFASDVANGNLSNISWVMPSAVQSDHPPYNVSLGQSWVLSCINQVEQSNYWNSTAIFLTWDDYGGFYDHVAPPKFGQNYLSFRAPLLVISPYARQGYLSHQLGEFSSLLRFIEWRYGFSNLTARDGSAALPLGYFDFNATPRPPMTIGANGNVPPYPMGLQKLPPPPAPTGFTVTAAKRSAILRWTPASGGTAVSWYHLAYHPAGNSSASHAIRIDGAANGFVVGNLTSGTKYVFTLQSVTGASRSAPVNATGVPTVPVGGLLPALATSAPGVFGTGPVSAVGAARLSTDGRGSRTPV